MYSTQGPQDLLRVALGGEGSAVWRQCAELIGSGCPIPSDAALAAMDLRGQCQALMVFGISYVILGDKRGIKLLQQSLTIARASSWRLKEGTVLGHMGYAYEQLKMDEADACHEQALSIAYELGDRRFESICLGHCGQAARRKNHLVDAIQWHLRSLAVAEAVKYQSQVGNQHYQLGILNFQLAQYETSLEHFQKALVIAQSTGNPAGQKEDLEYLGIVQEQRGLFDEAEQNYLEAERLFEESWCKLTVDELRVSHRDQEYPDGRGLQRVLLQTDRPWQALEVAERSRVRAFSLLVAERHGRPMKSLSLNGLRAVVQREQAALVYYSFMHDNEVDVPDTDWLCAWVVHSDGTLAGWKKLLCASTAHAKNIRELSKMVREGLGVRARGEPAHVDVENGTHVPDLDDTCDFRAPKIRACHADKKCKADKLLENLYEVLVQPLEGWLQSETDLLIVPDQELFVVPFLALRNSSTNTYLVQSYTVRTVASVSLLHQFQQLRDGRSPDCRTARHFSQTACIVSVSDFSCAPEQSFVHVVVQLHHDWLEKELRLRKCAAHLVVTELSNSSRARQLGVRPGWRLNRVAGKVVSSADTLDSVFKDVEFPLDVEFSGALPELCCVEDEAQKVESCCLAVGMSCKKYHNSPKQEAVMAMQDARIIHFATHGLLELDALLLRDDLLTAAEIHGLSLSADIAVLSACNTGRGELGSDGIVGLSRALMSAGVPCIMVSLWEVSDTSTAWFIHAFYSNWLERGLAPHRALQQVACDMLEQRLPIPGGMVRSRCSLPQHWGAFGIMGCPPSGGPLSR